jgi:hypothetical protein
MPLQRSAPALAVHDHTAPHPRCIAAQKLLSFLSLARTRAHDALTQVICGAYSRQ